MPEYVRYKSGAPENLVLFVYSPLSGQGNNETVGIQPVGNSGVVELLTHRLPPQYTQDEYSWQSESRPRRSQRLFHQMVPSLRVAFVRVVLGGILRRWCPGAARCVER